MRRNWLVFIVMLLAGLPLWGCGSSSGGTDTTATVSIADAARTGNCTICHTIDTHTFLNGIAGVNTATDGLGSAITHDCENCHGGGQYHHGDGPIPYPSPDGARCETCHSQATKVLASVHNANDEENVAMIADRHDSGVCQRCHTAEGFMALKSIVGNADTLDNGIVDYGTTPGAGQLEALNNLDEDGNHILHNPVCATCHNPLFEEMNTADPSWTPNGSSSAQLALCTSCHTYKLNDGTLMATGNTYQVVADAGVDGEFFTGDDVLSAGTATDVVGHHDTSWYRIIATTHYDNPDSPDVIEGYVIRENSTHPCFDCHGHELRTNTRRHGDNDPTDPTKVDTIYTEWAASAHAGKLLDTKEAAAAANPVTGDRGSAENTTTGHAQVEALLSTGATENQFTHPHAANWDDACQRCHTSTGYAAFADDPTGYTAGDGDFSNQALGQHEMVYCWACHSDAEDGTIRMTGAFTAEYTFGGNPVVFPDVGSSNSCIPCHSGRGIGGEDPGTSGYGVTHHYIAAAVLYSDLTHTGAEYPGQDYSKVSFFEHDIIGTASDDATGNTDAGPCAVCHMNAAGEGQPDHSFDVVEKDATTGDITALKSEACVNCHTGEHGAALVTEDGPLGTAAAAIAFLQEESDGYQNAGQLLKDKLALDNNQTNYTGGAVGASTGTTDDHRAFQTSLLTGNDPGGYAHNRYYVKRLLFDAIDWAEDGSIDGTIADYTATYPEAMTWFGGTTRP